MSLQTDIIFVRAIRSNTELIEQLPAGDVYNTTIALPEEEAMNAPVPYVIVSYDGFSNDQSTKDTFESEFDQVTIMIEVAAETRQQLSEIMEAVRSTVQGFFESMQGTPSDEDFALVPLDYQLSGSRVIYDDEKPCYWQTLTYQCDTNA